MADTAKYAPINGGTLITDFKNHSSLLTPKRTVACSYGFVFVFIAFTIFLAFAPTSNSSSPWFTDIFAASSSTSSNSTTSASIFSDESYRSHFSSIFSYFFPNSSTQVHNSTSEPSPSANGSPNNTTEPLNFSKEPIIDQSQTQNTKIDGKVASFEPNQSTLLAPSSGEDLNLNNNTANTSPPPRPSLETNEGSAILKNQTQNQELDGKGDAFKGNHSTIGVTEAPVTAEQTVNSSSPQPSSGEKNVTGNGENKIAERGLINNDTSPSVPAKQGIEDLVKSLMNCNLYDGNWVRDESYPLYEPDSCPLIDEQFNCFHNGRPDHDYYKLKWKPNGCTLPRLNGTHMLELLRGKRLVFVGDSLNRNMWESLVCILRSCVKDQKKVYEELGRHHFRGEASYSFIFEEYNCRVEFFVSPFLVQEWEITDTNGKKKETLRLDLIWRSADKYKNADVIIFNTGHWWTHEKTSKGEDYYQEGNHVYSELNVLEAFRKALTTWGRWVDSNINPLKTHVMFRGYSETHFSGGQWNSGGQCDNETEPIKNEKYLRPYSPKMVVFEEVMRGMKSQISYLNITRLTDFRKDGHPSIYRKKNLSDVERRSPMIQDCSHWCLPGVPDAWNELLYAEILVKQMQKHH